MRIANKVINGGKRRLSKLPQAIGITRRKENKDSASEFSTREIKSLRTSIADCIAQRGGRATAALEAVQLARQYLTWSPNERRRFLQILQDEYGLDEARTTEAIQAACQLTAQELQSSSQTLRHALTPARVELLRQWTLMPAGVKFLVDLRVDVQAALQDGLPLKPLDDNLKELLESLFNVGILQLQSIGWNSPAALLERLIRYEAVHAIQGWEDLKNRLDSDRRCFAFFHPNMPDEPLIFVEVALCQGVADNVLGLLDTGASTSDPTRADTAIFYSISNTQKGLSGIPFGDFLIKQVVNRLQGDVPNVRRYVTLSPMPGFRRWLESGDGTALLRSIDPRLLANAGCENAEALENALKELDKAHAHSAPTGFTELMRGLAMHYLATVKRPGRNTASDPVAHFHLSNGARIEQINWAANLTERGLRESYGMMVNYRYKLERIERHHEDYVHKGTVYVSKQVRGHRLRHKPEAIPTPAA